MGWCVGIRWDTIMNDETRGQRGGVSRVCANGETIESATRVFLGNVMVIFGMTWWPLNRIAGEFPDNARVCEGRWADVCTKCLHLTQRNDFNFRVVVYLSRMYFSSVKTGTQIVFRRKDDSCQLYVCTVNTEQKANSKNETENVKYGASVHVCSTPAKFKW
jgi:hypothetical protein